MHAWLEHVYWDGYSAVYGQSFLGMGLGSGVYLARNKDMGRFVVYEDVAKIEAQHVTVRPTDPIQQRIILPAGAEIFLNGAVIENLRYNRKTGHVGLSFGQ